MAIVAAFCVSVAELLVGKPVFENNRPHIAGALVAAGVVAWFVGRALQPKPVSAEMDPDLAPRRFVLFDLRYWGPMFLAFGIITLFIRPLKTVKPEPVLAKAKPAPKKEVVAPRKPPVVAVTPARPVFPKLKMQGVIYREEKPFAIINGKSYTIGDHIGDVVVRSIDRTSVMLEGGGEMKVLSLD